MATWTVSTYYKKSCEEHEKYYKDSMIITRKTGFRWSSFFVETSDNNPPEFEFTYVPGGDGRKDSINMYDCCVNNIENVELNNMNDGCWEDIEYPEDMSEDERERLDQLIEEEGDIYDVLENQEGWSQNDCEAWVWGPILIEDEAGNRVRIICADDNGNSIDFKEDDEDEEVTFAELSKINPETEVDIINSMPVWPFPTGKHDKEV